MPEVLAEAKLLEALQGWIGEAQAPHGVSPGLAGDAFAAGECQSPTSRSILSTLWQDIIL